MDRVITVRLTAERDGSLGASIARLRALRHRTHSFTQREYEFRAEPAVRAVARGAFDAIVAYAESSVDAGETYSIVDRRSVPAAYLDWSDACVLRTADTVEFLITHRLRICVTASSCGGLDEVSAEICSADDLDRHTMALQSVCDTVGFAPILLPALPPRGSANVDGARPLKSRPH